MKELCSKEGNLFRKDYSEILFTFVIIVALILLII